MDRRGPTGGLTPWSFFIPVALAVALGVLVANAIGAVFSGHATAEPPGEASLTKATPSAAAGPGASEAAVARPAAHAAATSEEKPLPVSTKTAHLPGPTSARRDGEARACINGTVARRASNGWEQEVVEDAPARCLADSP
jgi:hypothetical protein